MHRRSSEEPLTCPLMLYERHETVGPARFRAGIRTYVRRNSGCMGLGRVATDRESQRSGLRTTRPRVNDLFSLPSTVRLVVNSLISASSRRDGAGAFERHSCSEPIGWRARQVTGKSFPCWKIEPSEALPAGFLIFECIANSLRSSSNAVRCCPNSVRCQRIASPSLSRQA